MFKHQAERLLTPSACSLVCVLTPVVIDVAEYVLFQTGTSIKTDNQSNVDIQIYDFSVSVSLYCTTSKRQYSVQVLGFFWT